MFFSRSMLGEHAYPSMQLLLERRLEALLKIKVIDTDYLITISS